MKVSQAWLREVCDSGLSSEALASALTMAGLEVDGVQPVAAALDKVVVGEVLEAGKHPNADRLKVCKVSAGSGEQQVVCGAPNARAGLKAPFALVGARLGEMKVGKAKLRGVESYGMLCSAQELGLGEDHEGLLELPSDAPVGKPLGDYLALDDSILELDLTPNRGDCLSVLGLGREVSLLSGKALKPVKAAPVPAQSKARFPVELADSRACPRFVGRVLRGLDPTATSPLWLQERLRRSGIRSFNPIVDVTNYVMLELGQPLHAYDLAKLQGGIVVRQSKPGERLTLLDGTEVKLQADTLLITDARGPIGMAGVMGGLSTAVSDATVDVFLEAAFFAPEALAGRARAYGFATDAAHRFERGVDWQGQRRALERATRLLLELAGGKPGPVVDTVARQALPKQQSITLRASRVSLLLGVEIAEAQLDKLIKRLGFEARRKPGKRGAVWTVKAPSHRFDLRLEADLIEEIARIHGYDRLPITLPKAGLAMQPSPAGRLPLNRLKRQLAARGYHEAITYSFVDADLQRRLCPDARPVPLANPLSSELSVMRASLWPGLIQALQYNLNRQQPRVRLFEAGLVFAAAHEGRLAFKDVRQTPMLAGVAYGSRHREGWANDSAPMDFYDLKGDLTSLLGLGDALSRLELGMADAAPGFEFLPGSHPALHPGQCAQLRQGSDSVGYLGMLAPALQRQLEIRQPVYLFELQLDAALARPLQQSGASFRHPEVRRDLALVVDRSLDAAKVVAAAQAAGGDLLRQAQLFDVYAGEAVPKGSKSLALGLTFQRPSRTLEEAEVQERVAAVVAALGEKFGARLRG